jgi:hypothetical protein
VNPGRRATAGGALTCLLCILAPGPVIGAGISVRIPASYRSWEISDASTTATVSQAVAPINVTLPVSSQVAFLFRGGAQHGSLETDSTASLTGASDTRAALVLNLLEGRLVLHGGINAPTGPRELTTEEQMVALGLSPPHLGFRQRQPGRGLDAGGGASIGFPLSEAWSWGVGAGYLHHGFFRAREGGASIRPGAEVSISSGLDGAFSESITLSLDLTRRFYGPDDGGGAIYEEPDAWEGSLSFRAGESPWRWESAGYAVRKEAGSASLSPFSGWYLGGAAILLRGLGDRLMLGAGGEATWFRGELPEGELDRPTATTFGGGPALRLRLSEAVTVDAAGSILTGDEEDLSLSGWDARLSLQFLAGAE